MNLPQNLILKLKKYKDMRYGENPHQESAFYLTDSEPGFEQVGGLALSHNNLGDANHAWRLVCEFKKPTVAIVKHGNPSGCASRSNLQEAFKLAYGADKVSAYGGIIAVNRAPTAGMVEAMGGIFFELLVAPDFAENVLRKLAERSVRMRVVKAKKPPSQLEFTRVFNGYLVQTADDIVEDSKSWQVVCGQKPARAVWEDLEFAWKAVKHVKSNAIVIVKDKIMVGMGTGQPNRVNSVKLALSAAGREAVGAVLASDAFFPFADNVLAAAKAGVSVILQPGGSIHDQEVISEAKKHHMTMIFTGVRHFKH